MEAVNREDEPMARAEREARPGPAAPVVPAAPTTDAIVVLGYN
ncbi:hypothetical protein [Agromyces aerolatus]|nr:MULTISPECIES: hypothetical protein [unclassified Agromyces]MDR5701569.1 hypothetical protein [Agromyces sp. LY-1074]MDR5707824.1 hypothetical protein [Agromyces sp. LY-1358]